MSIGIRSILIVSANQLATSNTTLATITGMTYALAAGAAARMKFWIPFTLAGTASGAKFEVLPPTSPTLYLLSWKLWSGASTGSLAAFADQTTAAAFSNALASAANHLMEADLYIKAGVAGSVALQFAQLVSDAGSMTILQGGSMEITQL